MEEDCLTTRHRFAQQRIDGDGVAHLVPGTRAVCLELKPCLRTMPGTMRDAVTGAPAMVTTGGWLQSRSSACVSRSPTIDFVSIVLGYTNCVY